MVVLRILIIVCLFVFMCLWWCMFGVACACALDDALVIVAITTILAIACFVATTKELLG